MNPRVQLQPVPVKPLFILEQCKNCSGYGTKGNARITCPTCNGRGANEIPVERVNDDESYEHTR